MGSGRHSTRNRKTYLYRLWMNIRERCNSLSCKDYRYYGGRGIKVCPRWNSYLVFKTDILSQIGHRPSPDWTLDRKDNSKDYEPTNIRWATRETQSRNRSSFVKLTKLDADQIRSEYAQGMTTQIAIANKYGVSPSFVSGIVRGIYWK